MLYQLNLNLSFILICLLNSGAHADTVTPGNYIKSGSNECKIVNEQYWNLIQWFYGQLNIIHVNLIVKSSADDLGAWQHNRFLDDILKSNLCKFWFRIKLHCTQIS